MSWRVDYGHMCSGWSGEVQLNLMMCIMVLCAVPPWISVLLNLAVCSAVVVVAVPCVVEMLVVWVCSDGFERDLYHLYHFGEYEYFGSFSPLFVCVPERDFSNSHLA